MQTLAPCRPHEAVEPEILESLLDVASGPHDVAPGQIFRGINVEDEAVGPVEAIFPAPPG